jgi:hypothetical protein
MPPSASSRSSGSSDSDASGAFGPSGASLLALKAWASETFLKPAKPKDGDATPVRDRPMTDAEKRVWIKSLEPTERKWAYIVTAYGAVIAVLAHLQYLVGNPWMREKITTANGHTKFGWVNQTGSAEMLIGVGLGLMAVSAICTYFKKRAPLSFFLLLGGFATTSLFGLPLVVVAGWMFVRSWRVQRYGTPDAKLAAKLSAEMREQRKQSGGSSGGSGGFLGSLFGKRTPPATSPTAKASTAAAARSGPDASKRYTPKKQKKDSVKGNRYSGASRSGKS